MPGERLENNRTFLYVISGNIRQRVEEGTKGSVRRDFETSAGKKGTKFELVFKNWTGRIKDLVVKGTDFGEQLSVVFEDATLQLNCDSRYFVDLIKKLRGLDINQPVTVSPYDFESNGKRRMGMSVVQHYKKVGSYYDRLKDDNTWETINGFPVPEGGGRYLNKDDWKIYFLTVKKFLVGEVEKIREVMERPEAAEPEQERNVEDMPVEEGEDPVDTMMPPPGIEEGRQPREIPQIQDRANADDEVKLSDIPF